MTFNTASYLNFGLDRVDLNPPIIEEFRDNYSHNKITIHIANISILDRIIIHGLTRELGFAMFWELLVLFYEMKIIAPFAFDLKRLPVVKRDPETGLGIVETI